MTCGVPSIVASRRPPGARRSLAGGHSLLVVIAGDGADHGAHQLVPLGPIEQPGLVLGVRQITHFDQHRGYVGRLEDAEAGVTVGFTQQIDFRGQFGNDESRELGRQVHGFAHGQIDQDVGDIVVVAFADQMDAGDHVGLVFPGRQRLGLGVGGFFGQGIDGGAADPAIGEGVGVQGNEQIGAVDARRADPLGSRQTFCRVLF